MHKITKLIEVMGAGAMLGGENPAEYTLDYLEQLFNDAALTKAQLKTLDARIALFEKQVAFAQSQKSLGEKIRTAHLVQNAIGDLFHQQAQVINGLMEQRKTCKHEFTPAIRGYEHEGGSCKHCGINELAAHSK